MPSQVKVMVVGLTEVLVGWYANVGTESAVTKKSSEYVP